MSSSGVFFGKGHGDGFPELLEDFLRLVISCIDRAGIGIARDGHLEREQLGRRGIEGGARGGERDADAWPRLTGLLDHGGEVFEPDGRVGGAGA
jgi:hypothetical protein